ncbi:PAS domain S-box protein [Nocardioides antri]|uniref:PAS domain S-box protein n=2 Tax=Nocardioides antri TaxID=2607659 RepID=A0A5B1M4C5_9ACTN|nr:PAS domain S-box protein [Nocardioides antri]
MREVLKAASAPDLLEAAELAISELVTNAVVHAGSEIKVRIRAAEQALRVEIDDCSARLPVLRTWSTTSGTGRGLHIVDQSTDRWDADLAPHGKTVWFEIGQPGEASAGRASASHVDPEDPERENVVLVTLLDVPLLMHRAWQEHAATLLREYLLYALDEDLGALDDHAAASDAMSILDEQIPAPTLPDDPEALMESSVEPGVTAADVVLRLPQASVANIAVLDDVLSRARTAASEGLLLVPATQPEIAEMRQWLCREVATQAAGTAHPRPWRASSDVRAVIGDEMLTRSHRELASSTEPLIATDERYVIVAATPSVVRFLGYQDESELLGRRILVVIPERYHQAHIAGTTFHATNGRDVLLDRWITVPMVRADGSEAPVELHVESRLLDDDHRIFVATLRTP